MKQIARLSALSTLTLSALQAHAHEGHGMPGISHWHSTDAFGVMALAVVFGLCFWLGGRK